MNFSFTSIYYDEKMAIFSYKHALAEAVLIGGVVLLGETLTSM